ncbi:MAG: hypothetical protein JSR17_09820 [Proteobacteria bacterium]|nr:hypothetical protein [Pseudomonadota bacterium]
MSMDGVKEPGLKKAKRGEFVAPTPMRPGGRISPSLKPSQSAEFDEIVAQLNLGGSSGRPTLRSSRGALVSSDDRHSPLVGFTSVSSDDKTSSKSWAQLISEYVPFAEVFTPLLEVHRSAGKRLTANVDQLVSGTQVNVKHGLK